MEDPTAILDRILQFMNVAAWVAIAYFFMTGRVFSAVAVEKILEHAKDVTLKLVTEITSQIEQSVYTGFLRAHAEMNGRADKKEQEL